MSLKLIRSLTFALFSLGFIAALTPVSYAATPAEIAADVRTQWAESRKKLEASVAPLAEQPAHAELISQYLKATDKTGELLDQYLKLKLATPPTAPAVLTPVVDQLIKSLTSLKTLKGQAKGPLINLLGSAVAQQQETAKNAMKNIR
jgi:hypothetical protein